MKTVAAVVVMEAGARPVVVDVTLPEVGPGDVRVEIWAAGVCHSDLTQAGGTLGASFPLVLGHEASGVVAEVGSDIADLAVGDAVVLNWSPGCRECWFCTHEEPWLCEVASKIASVPRGSLSDGTPTHAVMGVGAMAEQIVVPRRNLVPIPPEAPLDTAALLGCAVLTGFGAVNNTVQVKPGETVLVVGLGGVGLAVVMAARRAGARRILAVDLSPGKRQLAIALGVTDFAAAAERPASWVRSLTDGLGVDHAFECVGNAATIRDAWSSTRRGGHCTIVGVGPAHQSVSFSPLELFHFARTLGSSVCGSSDPEKVVPELVAMQLRGDLDLELLISRRVGVAEAADAFDLMMTGNSARVLIMLGERGK